MAEGLSSAGLTGLTHSVNKREAARQDLATMGQLVQLKRQQEAEEQQAAIVEQQYYEQIRQEAEQMLVGDRKRINERSKNLQGQIRKQIKAFGGSRAKFMASGGLAMLGDYTRNVLQSPEVAQYKANKQNLEQILDIQKKGFGHLLSARDMTSLDEYNKNGYGEITFSGLKSEIVMPDKDTILFGKVATGSQILWNDKNYLKILGNFKIDNPDWVDPNTGLAIEDLPLPQQQAKLVAYTEAQGWAQRGNKVLPQQGYGNTGASSSSSTKKGKEEKQPISRSGDLLVHLTKFNQGLSLSDMSALSSTRNKYLADDFGGVKYTGKGTVEASFGQKGLSLVSGIATAGLWIQDEDNTFTPRAADDLGKDMMIPLWKTQNGNGYDVIGNTIQGLNPEEDNITNLYYANGVPVKDLSDLDKGDYKIKGAFMGYEIESRGNGYLVVDALDEDGKLNQKRNESLYVTEEGNPEPIGRNNMYIALEDPDGNTLYQKITYGYAQVGALGTHLGNLNDLTPVYTEADANRDLFDQSGEKTTIGNELKNSLNNVPNELFEQNDSFQAMVNVYNKYGGGRMRESLMKGFYMTLFDINTSGEDAGPIDFDTFINNDEFGNFMADLGLDNRLDDIRISDGDLLELMKQRILSEGQSTNKIERANNMLLIAKIQDYMMKARRGGKPKAMHGANMGFTPGSNWSVVKDFKGPSHSGGGIDINTNNLK